jgi:hypothetical protein
MLHVRIARPTVIAAGICLGAILVPNAGRGDRYVPTADPAFPRIKFADSLVSLNDRCVVSRTKLNPRVRPVYVSGQPVGFC